MKKKCLPKVFYLFILTLFLALPTGLSAQETPQQTPQEPATEAPKSDFWGRVSFGGGLGLGFGSGYANVAVLPSAIYQVNPYVALGLGVQYSYLQQRDFYQSHLYGGSIIGLFNPIEELQLSVELEQLRANVRVENNFFNGVSDNFWNTGLFLGAGYRMDNVTVGLRYNVLYVADKGVYGDALMPFVRAYF